jgi:aminoglycoside 6'-N-acetyltransferase I
MRQALYVGLDTAFHDREMQWIFRSRELSAFIALSATDEAIGILELSLRNVVDGCVGGPVGYIEGMYLEPVHRGRGYGRQMIAFATDWFRARGCKEMATDAEIDNAAAQAFYRRVGFREGWRVVGFTRPIPPARGNR